MKRASLFAIGDVHGCSDELSELLAKLPLEPDSTVVLLGDYVDRGPRAREVITILLALRERHRVVALLGNHERMFLEFLAAEDSSKMARFVYSGGTTTLASYADERGVWDIPDEHLEFLRGLPLVHQTSDYIFVHAGIPDRPLSDIDPRRDEEFLLWARASFLASTFQWSKVVVHGHTVVPEVEQTPTRIDVDTGCVYDGRLSAIELPSRHVYSVPRRSPAPAPPTLRDRFDRRAAVRFEGALPVMTDHAGAVHRFEAIDFSEVGLQLRALSLDALLVYRPGASIEGTIDPNGGNPVTFRGRVVRRVRVNGVWHYGVQILERTDASEASEGPGGSSGETG